MHEFIAKTRKNGDSIVVTLPKDIVEAEQIKENMNVKVTVQKSQNGFSKPERVKPKGKDDPWRLLE